MEKKNYVLFDLDGTLTDPKEGITKSVQYALRHYGIEVEDLDSLCPFIGPPLTDSYIKFYNFSPEQAREGVWVYREYFNDKGWKENRVFNGIPEMLAALREADINLLMATSKPEEFAVRIAEHFGISSYFTFIGGADLEETRVKKGDVIGYVMEHCGITAEDVADGRVWMVGDREHDVYGAGQWNIPAVGVLFGYGSREELEACGADKIVSDVEELKNFLLTVFHKQRL